MEFIKKYKKILLAIILTFILILSCSFAWFKLNKTSTVVNKIKAGNLELVLDDTTTDGILLEKAIPLSETNGKKTVQYTFTLENKGSTAANYTIYLDDIPLNDNEIRMQDKYVRYRLLKNNVLQTKSGIYEVKLDEQRYVITFDENKHKVVNITDYNNNSVSGFDTYLNSKLTDESSLDDLINILKDTHGQTLKYSTESTEESKLVSTMGTNPERILETGAINSKEKNSYTLQIWIDKDATNDVMGTIFNAKLRVEAVQKASAPTLNPNIVGIFNYKEDTCVNGKEDTCVINNCLVDKEECSPGTIINYRVSDTETIGFNVLHEDKDTITLQAMTELIPSVAWHTGFYTTTEGPKEALAKLDNYTNTWSNVIKQTFTLGTTTFLENPYTGCDNSSYTCDTNYYTMDEQTINARMITVQEAKKIGCSKSTESCPKWAYNMNSFYWTMNADSVNDGFAIYISRGGFYQINSSSTSIGIRPVVTIKKYL